MEFDDNFEIACRGPSDGLKEVLMLPRDVRFTGANIISPIPDRDPHVIESKNKYNTQLVELEQLRMRQYEQARTQQLQSLQSHLR